MMDDATQKLVDRVKDYPTITRLSHKTQIELIEQLRDALEAAQRRPEGEAFAEAFERFSTGLDYSNRDEAEAGFRAGWEAAQRPPVSTEEERLRARVEAAREAWWSGTEQGDTGLVYTDRIEDAMDAIWDAIGHADWTPRERPPVAEPDNHHNADLRPFCTRNRDEREAAIRAEALAQRPPVSPEVRDALIEALLKVPGNERGPAHGEPGFWPYFSDDEEDRRDAGRFVDAILAQWSLPVLDVEKVAQWLDEATSACGMGFWATADRDRLAAALVASLHTLTTDGTPADTERNES